MLACRLRELHELIHEVPIHDIMRLQQLFGVALDHFDECTAYLAIQICTVYFKLINFHEREHHVPHMHRVSTHLRRRVRADAPCQTSDAPAVAAGAEAAQANRNDTPQLLLVTVSLPAAESHVDHMLRISPLYTCICYAITLEASQLLHASTVNNADERYPIAFFFSYSAI